MGRIFLMSILTIVSSAAMADWVKINNKDNLTTYVDPSTISKDGNIVKMWGVVDLKESRKEQDGKSFLSAKGLQEFNCEAKQIRKLSLTLFSGNMGVGEVVHTYSDADKWKWTPVEPGSISETMLNAACKKN